MLELYNIYKGTNDNYYIVVSNMYIVNLSRNKPTDLNLTYISDIEFRTGKIKYNYYNPETFYWEIQYIKLIPTGTKNEALGKMLAAGKGI